MNLSRKIILAGLLASVAACAPKPPPPHPPLPQLMPMLPPPRQPQRTRFKYQESMSSRARSAESRDPSIPPPIGGLQSG